MIFEENPYETALPEAIVVQLDRLAEMGLNVTAMIQRTSVRNRGKALYALFLAVDGVLDVFENDDDPEFTADSELQREAAHVEMFFEDVPPELYGELFDELYNLRDSMRLTYLPELGSEARQRELAHRRVTDRRTRHRRVLRRNG